MDTCWRWRPRLSGMIEILPIYITYLSKYQYDFISEVKALLLMAFWMSRAFRTRDFIFVTAISLFQAPIMFRVRDNNWLGVQQLGTCIEISTCLVHVMEIVAFLIWHTIGAVSNKIRLENLDISIYLFYVVNLQAKKDKLTFFNRSCIYLLIQKKLGSRKLNNINFSCIYLQKYYSNTCSIPSQMVLIYT